jgi:hypothetical protein
VCCRCALEACRLISRKLIPESPDQVGLLAYSLGAAVVCRGVRSRNGKVLHVIARAEATYSVSRQGAEEDLQHVLVALGKDLSEWHTLADAVYEPALFRGAVAVLGDFIGSTVRAKRTADAKPFASAILQSLVQRAGAAFLKPQQTELEKLLDTSPVARRAVASREKTAQLQAEVEAVARRMFLGRGGSDAKLMVHVLAGVLAIRTFVGIVEDRSSNSRAHLSAHVFHCIVKEAKKEERHFPLVLALWIGTMQPGDVCQSDDIDSAMAVSSAAMRHVVSSRLFLQAVNGVAEEGARVKFAEAVERRAGDAGPARQTQQRQQGHSRSVTEP